MLMLMSVRVVHILAMASRTINPPRKVQHPTTSLAKHGADKHAELTISNDRLDRAKTECISVTEMCPETSYINKEWTAIIQ